MSEIFSDVSCSYYELKWDISVAHYVGCTDLLILLVVIIFYTHVC
jgi:type IV secretory pathway TrbL component